MEKSNEEIEVNIAKSAGVGGAQATPDDVHQMVSTTDPFSEKIIHLVSKYNALEDCMAAVKKGFEKDSISL